MYDLDTWKSESCFDEVKNSSWAEDLQDKVTSKHRHFSFVTYDDAFEVVCEDYTLDLLTP